MHYDTPEEALKACVAHLGGNPRVGVMLWPDMEESAKAAGQKLADHLNDDRREKLSLSQIVFIFKKAQSIGFHDGMYSWNRLCAYGPSTPLSTADVIAETQRNMIAAAEQFNRHRLEFIKLSEESGAGVEPTIALRAVRS